MISLSMLFVHCSFGRSDDELFSTIIFLPVYPALNNHQPADSLFRCTVQNLSLCVLRCLCLLSGFYFNRLIQRKNVFFSDNRTMLGSMEETLFLLEPNCFTCGMIIVAGEIFYFSRDQQ